MLLDEKYEKYIWHYRTGRVNGPAEYTYKRDGFRVLYGKKAAMCQGCGQHKTHWFIIYFDPRQRFRKWDDRDKESRMICSTEDIDTFLGHILMERVNASI